MKRVSLIAAKTLRYGTRRLRAGDTFDATRQDARVLTAVGLASDAPRQMLRVGGLDPKSLISGASMRQMADRLMAFQSGGGNKPAAPAEPDLAKLRAEYEAITGKRPHHMWRAPRLAAEIEAAKSAKPPAGTDAE